ncbi:MAG: calcium-binding protein [Pikeienuella sp.]|uniref:calcium-binding protein n=1 Tax=Pikeienuella sp. TaxID=2831957 RepID=UPI00391C14CC
MVVTDLAGIGINMRDTSAFTANDGDFIQEDGAISGGTFEVEGRYTTSEPRFGFASGLVAGDNSLIFETFVISTTRIDLIDTNTPQDGLDGLVWLIDGIATTFSPSPNGGDLSTFDLSGNETLEGASFADTLFGGAGDDSLVGGGGDDDLSGDGGNDTILGGAGDDRIAGGAGANVTDGGAGADILLLDGAFSDYTVTQTGSGVTLTRAGESHVVLNVEAFQFTDGSRSLSGLFSPDAPTGPTEGDDRLTGTPGPDRIAALGGDDTVRGLGDDDTLLGQNGDDILRGGGGDDELKGGGGADTLVGQSGNDTLRGGGDDDLLKGGVGDDRMIGMGGDDRLKGGGGADFLKGGGGADRLIGGGGADTIEGNKGDDTLKGGNGPDTFRFKPGDGDDVIQRFQQGVDQVEFKRGVAGFGALEIEQQGDDVLVSYKRGSILFENQNAGAFDADDFIF